MLWGHRNDPVNFHRCLQDFDRRLPDLLERAARGRPAHRHLRPRLRPDDALDRPLARARAAARLRRRAATRPAGSTRGRVRRRRGDRQRLARRARRRARMPGKPILERRDRTAAELIQRKRDGEELGAGEIAELVLGYARGDVPDYQMAAFCMAVYFRGLSTARDLRAHRRDGPQRRDDRPRRGARPQGRRQALDRRGGGQDLARGRADRRRLRRAVREDERPRARAHRRDARQARVDPGLPGRAVDRRVRSPRCARSASRSSGRPPTSSPRTSCSTRCAT